MKDKISNKPTVEITSLLAILTRIKANPAIQSDYGYKFWWKKSLNNLERHLRNIQEKGEATIVFESLAPYLDLAGGRLGIGRLKKTLTASNETLTQSPLRQELDNIISLSDESILPQLLDQFKEKRINLALGYHANQEYGKSMDQDSFDSFFKGIKNDVSLPGHWGARKIIVKIKESQELKALLETKGYITPRDIDKILTENEQEVIKTVLAKDSLSGHEKHLYSLYNCLNHRSEEETVADHKNFYFYAELQTYKNEHPNASNDDLKEYLDYVYESREIARSLFYAYDECANTNEYRNDNANANDEYDKFLNYIQRISQNKVQINQVNDITKEHLKKLIADKPCNTANQLAHQPKLTNWWMLLRYISDLIFGASCKQQNANYAQKPTDTLLQKVESSVEKAARLKVQLHDISSTDKPIDRTLAENKSEMKNR